LKEGDDAVTTENFALFLQNVKFNNVRMRYHSNL